MEKTAADWDVLADEKRKEIDKGEDDLLTVQQKILDIANEIALKQNDKRGYEMSENKAKVNIAKAKREHNALTRASFRAQRSGL